MRNVKIEGGRDVGPPKSWNTETDGECLTLSVLFHDAILPRLSSRTTAWQFTPEELDALANGGHFFLSPRLPFVPVMSLWVQDAAGKVIGELRASASPGEPEEDGVRPENSDKERARADRAVMVAGHLRAGIIAVGRELDKALGINRATPASDWPALDNAGIIARLAELARSPFMSGKRADLVLHDVPPVTLDDVLDGKASVNAFRAQFPSLKPVYVGTERTLSEEDKAFLQNAFWQPVVMGIDLAAPDKSDMTGPEPTPDAAAVLDYVDTFAGQEDEAGQVCEFVQFAAKYIFERRPADDWQANDTLSGFYSWWQDERETFPRG